MPDVSAAGNGIRSDLVDITVEFLSNPKISGESMQRKRDFLRMKGLTDTEIKYAFELIPQPETTKLVLASHRPSSLRRFVNQFVFAGFLMLVIRMIKQFLQSKTELHETVKALQKSVQNVQTSVTKLEQTANQLQITMRSSNPNRSSAIEEIKREIQGLKGLFVNRSQVPPWQSKSSETLSTSDNDNDEIVVISKQEKKSDDE